MIFVFSFMTSCDNKVSFEVRGLLYWNLHTWAGALRYDTEVQSDQIWLLHFGTKSELKQMSLSAKRHKYSLKHHKLYLLIY